MTAALLTPYARPAHAKAARALCDALTLGDQETFAELSVILHARLTRLERRALAWAVLRACDDEEVVMVAESIIPPQRRAGWPVTPLDDVVAEASHWADYASPEELQVYADVCSSRLAALHQSAA